MTWKPGETQYGLMVSGELGFTSRSEAEVRRFARQVRNAKAVCRTALPTGWSPWQQLDGGENNRGRA